MNGYQRSERLSQDEESGLPYIFIGSLRLLCGIGFCLARFVLPDGYLGVYLVLLFESVPFLVVGGIMLVVRGVCSFVLREREEH